MALWLAVWEIVCSTAGPAGMYACGARTLPKSSRLVSAGHSVSPSGEPVWSAVSSPGIPLAVAVGSGQRLNYHFSTADLAAWPGKVLILQSDDDPTTKPAMRAALRALYTQAQVHTFHRAGHTPSLSQPDVFYSRVRAFLLEP